ncbi:uncharacterized protein LOC141655280 [Silene latifolia]|uniref:uncharacterized protein LOC141655280 n=1 Tax=Silene latifolia TaxID=37657 RepID=UPI003D778C78
MNGQDDAWYQIHGRKIIQIIEEEPEELLQLTKEDVQSELDYWQQAVVGFIVGANPPWQILESFLKRICSKYVIDKISFLSNDVFLARFHTEEMKQAVLNSAHFLFDNKPLILKQWQPDVELTKDEVKSVLARVRMHKLPLKFWGNSLPKLAGLIDKIIFLDENQNLVSINIEYQWKPSICSKCKHIGHELANCRTNKQRVTMALPQKVWRPIPKQPAASITTKAQICNLQNDKEQRRDETKIEATPVSKIKETRAGSLSPVRQVRATKQGIGLSPDSPTYREALTVIYALNGVGEMEDLWLNLKSIAKQIQGPWALGGDFNCVLLANERLGGRVTEAESEPFSECLQQCEVMDIQASGAFYTWNNKQPLATKVYSRLDRFFVNKEWTTEFPDFIASFLPEGHFDHCPCLICKRNSGWRQKKPFKYFNM